MVLINSRRPSINRTNVNSAHEGSQDPKYLPGLPTHLSTNPGAPPRWDQVIPWKSVPTFSYPIIGPRSLKYHNASLVSVFCLDYMLTSPEGMPLMYGRISSSAEFFWLLIHATELWNILSALITTASQGGMLSSINYKVHITNLLEGSYAHTLL